MFQPHPEENAAKPWPIDRFGPVGLSLELAKPGMTIYVKGVEEGSPAAATGKFKKGQIIEKVNGKKLDGRDPRIVLGDWITESEANGGKMTLVIADKPGATPQDVTVQLQDMGKYSATWPEDCPKSDKIVRQFAEFLAKVDKPNYGAAMFLLSTGEQKDLDVVRGWYSGKLADKKYDRAIPWDIGYDGSAVCEYYLRTGDKSVLPAIQSMADRLKNTIYRGGWAGRGGAPYGYGSLNAAGVHCVTFLMLAKECGVNVDEETFNSALRRFFRFSGKGNLAYGNSMPEGGFVDNGKTSKLAFAMAAAAALTGDQKNSVYAKARDINATKTFYSTTWLFHGHTGGGIGELWRGQGMTAVKEQRPVQHRSFMDNRRWMYDLARTHDGAFGWFGGWNVSYTETGHEAFRSWGNFIPLIFTQHKKNLRIHGAPKTKFSNIHELPERPWGNKNDDAFLSMTPGEYAPGKRIDISKELLETHASLPLSKLIADPKASDEILLGYALHIDQGIRAYTAKVISSRGKVDLVTNLLQSQDPRGRQAGLLCLTGMFKGSPLGNDKLTPEMFELVGKMIEDPAESWWVKIHALQAIGRAPVETIAKHRDTMIKLTEHNEWWMSSAAIEGLTKLATDKNHYQPVLTALDTYARTISDMPAMNPVQAIAKNIKGADKQIQEFAIQKMGAAYLGYQEKIATPGAQDLSEGVDYFLDQMAGNLAQTPGGTELLYRLSKQRNPDKGLPHPFIYMDADLTKLDPEISKELKPLFVSSVIPAKKEEVGSYLKNEIKTGIPGRAHSAIVKVYEGIGIDEFSWKNFGPHEDEIKWAYHTFTPQEKINPRTPGAYRQVTWPAGMEKWYEPGFDFKRAGWKVASAPFGGTMGKKEYKGRCSQPYCKCASEIETLWDKEVLMMHTQMDLPPLKEGHAYSLWIGGRSHVNTGDGSDVWINGKRVFARAGFTSMAGLPGGLFLDEQNAARTIGDKNFDGTVGRTGRRMGGTPRGFILTEELKKEVAEGKFTLAVTGFNHPQNSGGNRQSVWFTESKILDFDESEESSN